MTRRVVKWAVAVALGAAAWAGSPGSVRAQWYPGYMGGGPFFGPGGLYNPMNYYPGIAYGPGYGAFLNYNFVTPYYGTTYNPITGSLSYPIYLNVWGMPVNGYIPLNGRAGSAYGQYPTGGGMHYGGTGGYAYNPLAGEQLRALRGARVEQPANDVAARRAVADLWNADRGGRAEPPVAGVAQPLDQLVNAPEDLIQSGKAVNELVVAIRGLEAKGAKAESPLLPAGLLAQVNYAGGPAAEALMLLRQGKPEYPEPLKAARFDGVRGDLEKPVSAVADPLLAGKKADAAAADKLAAAVQKARTDVAPAVRDLLKPEAAAITRFLDRLDALADVAKAPGQGAGLVVPKWSTVGASAAEFVAHLDKFKLTVAPADPSAAEAYDNLYRGLAGYYVGLTRSPPKK